MTDLLVEITPKADARSPSILPIQIVTENEGQQSVNVTVAPEGRSPPPEAARRLQSPITLPASPHMAAAESAASTPRSAAASATAASASASPSPTFYERSPASPAWAEQEGAPRGRRTLADSFASEYDDGARGAQGESPSADYSSAKKKTAPAPPRQKQQKARAVPKYHRAAAATTVPPRGTSKPVMRKKVSEVVAAAAGAAAPAKKKSAVPTANSVQSFLAKHPEFAEEFSYTIPVSPNPMGSSASSSASATGFARKGKSAPAAPKRPIRDDEEDEMEPMVHSKDPDDEDDVEEDDEEEEEDYTARAPPAKSKNAARARRREPEPEPEDDASEPEDVEAAGSEIEDAIDHENDVFGTQPKGGARQKDAAEDEDEDGAGSGSDEEEDDEPEAPAQEEDKSRVKDKDKKKKEEKPLTEEEEAMEKMELIEDIKEGAKIGFMPPQAPTFDMTLSELRRIKKFQDEKAAEAIHIGYMGTGLVGIVNILETLNGKFDPFEKIFGNGLKMQGAKATVENNLHLYRIPFTKLYRRLRRSGIGGELPPWAQIILITSGIIGEVHKTNVLREMEAEAHKEEQDPEAMRRAREMMIREHQLRQARARDAVPYHVEMMEQQQQQGGGPLTDAQLEAVLEKEFAGFDKLPTIDSLHPPVATAAPAAGTPVPEIVGHPLSEAEPKRAFPVQMPQKQRPAPKTTTQPSNDSTAIHMVHETPKEENEDINLTHSTGPEDTAADGDDQPEAEEEEDGGDDDDYDSGSQKAAPIIQIPILASSKKRPA